MLSDYLNWVGSFVENWGYIAIFLGMMLENIVVLGLIFPGLFILIMGGYFAGYGDLNLGGVLLSSYFGILMGDNASYLLGRYGLINIALLKKISPKLEQIEKAIRLNTEKFLVFFQFPVYSRMILPAFLGILKFDFRKWFVLDAIGAFLFSLTFSLLGYTIGKTTQALDTAIQMSNYIQWAFFVIFIWWFISVIRSVWQLFGKKESNS